MRQRTTILILLSFFFLLSPTLKAQVGPAGVGDFSKTQLWLRSDFGVFTIGFNQVVIWQDQSGHGRNFSVVVSGQQIPILTSSMINGFPSLVFNDNGGVGGQFLGYDGPLGFSGGEGATVFLVAKNTTPADEVNGGLYIGEKNVGGSQSLRNYGIEYNSAVRFNGSNQIYNDGHTLNDWKILSYLNQDGSQAQNYTSYLDGVQLTGSTAFTNVPTTVATWALLGASEYDGTFDAAGYLNGEISEVVVFTDELSEAERRVVENHLSAKYNISTANDFYSHQTNHYYEVTGFAAAATTQFTTPYSGSILYMDNPTDLIDDEYLFFGHQNGSISSWLDTEVPVTGMKRLAREWNFDETGDVGTVTVNIPRAQLPIIPVGYTNAGILIDNDGDGDFSTGSPEYYEMTEAAGIFSVSVDINDNDQLAIVIFEPVTGFSVSAGSSSEGAGTYDAVVSINYPQTTNVTVDFASADVTATLGADYTLMASPVTILAGNTSANITITLLDEAIPETDETFNITLSNPSIGVLGTTVYTQTINDDDNAYLASFSAASGSGVEDPVLVNIPVVLDIPNATAGNLTVDYEVTGGTASNGTDYTLANGTLTFPIGNALQNIVLSVNEDFLYEPDETVIITLTGTGSVDIGLQSPTVHTHTINDDDVLPDILFASSTSSGAESFQQIDLLVILTQAIGVDVTVDYDVTAGTATAGTDFVAASGQITIQAGSTLDSLTFDVIDDGVAESNETVIITLSNPVNAALGAIDQNTYAILDDDGIGWEGPGGITNFVQNKLWYNAELTNLSDNSNVNPWIDLSGNNHDAFQNTSTRQPLFQENIWNSRPILNFDGGDGLQVPDNPDVNTGGPYDKKTLNVVFRTGADVATRQVLYEEGGAVRGLVMYIDAGTLYVAGWNYNNDDAGLTTPWPFISVSTPVTANTPYLAGMEFDFDGVSGIGNVVGYLNGDTISILPGAGRLFNHPGDIGLGWEKNDTYFHDGPDNGDGFYFTGFIGEFINSLYIYNLAQKNILNNYYSSKWQIPVTKDLFAYDATHSWEVFGIGREDINNTHTISQGTGYIKIENPSSLDDGDYLLIGHDKGALTWTSTGVPDGDPNINMLNRVWRGDETTTGDGVGTIKFNVDINNFAVAPAGFSKYVLISDTDADFSSGATISELTYDVGNDLYYADNVDLSGDTYFTVGIVQPAIEWTLTIGSGLENLTPVNVEARLNFIPTSNVTADITVGGTATDGSDFTVGAAQVLIPSGQQTASVQLAIIDDPTPEGDETVVLSLSNPSGGVIIGTNITYTYTIQDDDDAYEVQFSLASFSNDESVLTYNIPVELDIAHPTLPVFVDYNVTGGTASDPDDFSLASGTLTIASGSTNGIIPLTIVDDGLFESSETVIVSLSNPVNANLGAQTNFTYTITDNETPVGVNFDFAIYGGVESYSPANLLITLTGASSSDVIVYYSAFGGTANNIYAGDNDYVILDGSFHTVPAGLTQDTINFLVFNDVITEAGIETIDIRIDSVHGGIVGSILTQCTYNILDDDGIGYIGPGGVGDDSDYMTWIRSDYITLADGSGVNRWEDASTNNDEPVQNNGGRQPIFNSVLNINGQPYVDFDGSNDRMDFADDPDLNNGGPYTSKTIVLSLRTDGDIISRQMILQQGSQNRGITIYIDNGSIYMGAYNLSSDGAGTPWGYTYFSNAIGINTVYNVILEFEYDSGTGTSFINGYLNGEPLGTNTAGPLYGDGGNLRIGRRTGDMMYHDGMSPNNSGDYFSGDLMEILSWNEILNTPQRILVDNYLATKFGFDAYYDHYDYEIGPSYEPNGIGIENNEVHISSKGSGIVRLDQPTNTNNGNYLIVGHDNGSIASWSVNLANGVGSHFARKWRADESGEFGNVRIAVDSLILPAKTLTFDKWVLMVDTDGDGDFDTGTIDYYALDNSDGSFVYNQNVDLEPGDYFTFGIARNVSAQTGNWSDPNSWTINVPTSSEDAIILNGHTITLDANASIVNLDINLGGELQLSSNQLELSGTITNNGTFTSQTGTIMYNSANVQSITALSYYNLFFAGTGLKTFAGNIDVNNDFSISEVGTTVNSGANSLTLGGDWFNRGSFEELSGSVDFDGTGTFQVWRQDGLSENFYDLTVSAGVSLASNVNISVVSTLTMSGGSIDMNGNVFLLGVNDAQPGTLVYNSGWIMGRFGDWITDSQDGVDLVFPIGVSGYKRSLTFNFADVSTSGFVYSEFDESVPVTNGLPINESGYIVNQLFGEGYWSMLKDGLFDFTGTFNMSVVPAGMTSYGIDANTRTVSRFTASDWFFNGDHVAGGPALLQRDNLTQFVYEYAVGYSETCVATIDNCPVDIAASNDAGDCQALVTWTAPTIGGGCSGFTLTSTYNSGDAFPVGTTEVKYYLMNGIVKEDSCSFDITITDSEVPVVICQDITVVLDATGNASIVAADIDNGSTDNCGIATMVIDQSSFNCSDQGVVPVTLTVTDVNGNFNTCLANVTVNSSLSITSATVQTCNAIPGIAAVFESTVVGGDGNYTYLWDGLEDAFDHFMTITLFPPSIVTSNTSTDENPLLSWFLPDGTYNVRLYVTDGNGCIDSTDINFTKTGLTTNNVSVLYTDECEGATVTYTRAFDATATYDWTAENGTILSAITDTNEIDVLWDIGATDGVLTTTITQPGPFGDCESSVIDSLTIHPIPTPAYVAPIVAVCSGQSETYTLSSAYANHAWTWTNGTRTAGGTATDNFITILWGTTSPGNVQVDVTTVWGCTASTDVDVTIYDVAGTITAQTNESCAGNNDGSVTVTATVGSGLAPYEYSIDGGTNYYASGTFGTLTAGVYNVIIRDALGCTSNVPVTIIVEDLIDPVAICQDITIQLSAGGGATITAADIDNGSNDACGILSLSLDITSFDCGDIGANTVTLTVTDVNSNTATCTATVTIVDNIDPILTAPADLVAVCDISEQPAYADYAAFTAAGGTATDNCSVDGTTFTLLSEVSNGLSCPETVTRTYQISDVNGNTDTDVQLIVIDDNIAPLVVEAPSALDAILECSDAAGLATALALSPSFTDNCTAAGSIVITLDSDITTPDGSCANAYVRVRTWSASDDCGNNSLSYTQTITVQDNTAPVVVEAPSALDATLECSDAAGLALALAQAPTFTDNCTAVGVIVISLDSDVTTPEPGCANGYTRERTWTASDGCGNTSLSYLQTIIVQDNTAPVVVGSLTDATIEGCTIADAPAAVNTVAGLEALAGGITITDACSVDANLVVTSSDANAGTCPIVITRTYTVTDECGNSVNIVHIINIDDTTAPVLSLTPADVTVECDAVPVAPGITATDNCDGVVAVNFSEVITPGACANTYTITRDWDATDACGNVVTHTQIITVEDTTAPVVVGSITATTVEGCAAGDAPAAETTVAGLEGLVGAISITDNCSVDANIVVTSSETSAGTCPIVITRTYTLTDECGNFSTVVHTINVDDSTAPVVVGSLTDATVEGCAAGDAPAAETTVAGIEALAGGVTITDACSVDANIVVTSSETSAGTCPIVITRTYTLTDECGNFSTVVHTINVDDSTAPVVVGSLTDATIEGCTIADAPAAVNTVAGLEALAGGITITDACSVDANLVVTSSDANAGTCPIVITRTYTVTDECGNSVNIVHIINIDDTTAPVLSLTPADVTVECDAVPVAPGITATDNCDGVVAVNFSEVITPGACANTYTITRDWDATDACGNVVTHTQIITVEDTTAPVVVGSITATTVEGCAAGDAPAAETTVAGLEGLVGAISITDNCSVDANIVVTSSETSAGTCPIVITRTYTLTDECGNFSTVVHTINVDDSTAPVVVGSLTDVTVEGCAAGDAPAAETTVAGIEALAGGVTITDACSVDANIVVTSSETSAGTCPIVITRTYTLTDECGNFSTVVHTINVDDSTAPVVVGSLTDATIEGCTIADAPAAVNTVAGLEALAGGITITDACSVDANLVVTSSDANAGTCPIVITRTYTVTDECGNSVNIVHIINIDDTTAPVLSLTPADVTVECDAVPVAPGITATDNCDGVVAVNFSEVITPGACANTYTITRDWDATDACGNVVTHTQIITVEDTTAPVVVGSITATTVEGCAAGDAPAAETTVAGLEGLVGAISITDNCSVDANIVVTSSETSAGTCPIVITRTYTLTDECGNFSTVVHTINVDDSTAPVVVGSLTDVTVEGCAAGDAPAAETTVAGIEALAGGVTITDACSVDANIVVTSSETSAGTCPIVITRTYTLTDECGNFSTVVHTINVDDSTAPVVVGSLTDATIEGCTIADAPAAVNTVAGLEALAGGITITDACSVDANLVVTSSDANAGTCPIVITRTYTVTDECGNSVNIVHIINIDDTTAPVLSLTPADVTVECDAVPVAPGITATDNCDGVVAVNFSEVITPGACANTYTITRDWDATDACGNVVTHTQIITVEDTTAPVVVGSITATTVEGCAAGDAPAAETTVAGLEGLVGAISITDNCSVDANIVVTSSETSAGTCPIVITRTYTLTDECGNFSTVVHTINVDDSTAPVVVGSLTDATVEGCAAGDAPAAETTVAGIEALAGGVTITDACSVDANIVVTSSETSAGTCPIVITRTYTLTDECGNFSTVVHTINVDDSTAPVVVGSLTDATIEGCTIADAPAAVNTVAGLEALAGGITITDACSVDANLVVTSSDANAGTCPIVITRTYTVTDECGNSVNIVHIINIDDTTAPVLSLTPADVTVECDAVPVAPGITATDNCDGVVAVNFSEVITPGACANTYTITRDWDATDACGNVVTHTQIITVEDTTAPVVVGSITATTVEGCAAGDAPAAETTVAGLEGLVGAISITDNCSVDANIVVTSSETSAGTCPIVITRTYTLTDECGNFSTVVHTINVDDSTAPVVVGSLTDATVEGCAAGDAPAAETTVAGIEALAGGVTITDACSVDANIVVTSSETSAGTCPIVITRTYTLTDECGNFSTVVHTINVDDSTAPVVVGSLTDATIEGCTIADAPAAVNTVAGLEALAGGITITDACSVDANLVVTSSDANAGTCPIVITRTYTVTDECGNSVNIVHIINIDDTTAPVLSLTPADVTVECDAVPVAPGITATDNCDGVVAVNFSEVITPGACANTYTITRDWDATDACGNVVTHTQIITVEDTTAPVVVGSITATTVEGCAAGDAPAAETTVAGLEGLVGAISITDNCSVDANIVVTSSETSAGTCPIVITRTYTLTDECGNFSTVVHTINVDDSTAPVVVGSLTDVTVEGCAAGDAPAAETTVAGIEALAGGVTITDACSVDANIVVTSSETSAGTCPIVITRTYTLTDECGNFSTVVHTINVDDSTAPVVVGSLTDATIEGCTIADAPAAVNTVAGLEALAGGITITDACSVDANLVVTSSDANAGTCPIVITRTYTVTDECGNSVNIVHIINIDDTTAPILTLSPGDVTVECDAIPAVPAITAIDNCDGIVAVNFTETITPGACANTYTITRDWDATDACGNTVTHTQTISVEDTTNPTIIGVIPATSVEGCDIGDVPAAVATVAALEALGGIAVSDNCSADVNMTVTFTDTPSGSCPLVITRAYTVTDECGNSSIVNHIINIEDTTSPVVTGTIAASSVEGCGLADLPVAETTVAGLEAFGITIDDACSLDANIIVTSSETSAGTCPITVTRTYTVTDECGNSTNINHTINIDDTTLPVLTAPADISVDCIGSVPPVYSSYAEWIGAGGLGSDNCSLNTATFAFAGVVDNGLDCPKTLTRTYYIEDVCGNFITVDQDIVIDDVTPPVLTAPVQIDIECIGDIPAVYVSLPEFQFEGGTAVDNCGIDASSFTHVGDVDNGLFNPKTITRTYELADNCGNTSQVDQLIVIDDVTAPVPDLLVLPDITDECSVLALVAPTATDNCGGVVTVTHDATLPITAQGTTLVTWTYDDGNGNTSTQPQNVILTDITAPVPDVALLPDLTDECSIAVLVPPTATDNCGGVVTVTHDATLPITAQGTTLVTWTYDDGNGNTVTQPQNVILTDVTDPIPDLALLPDVTDECSVVALVAPTATDNCGGVVTVTHDATLPITAQGTTLVTWTYDDGNGNTVTQPQNVILTDITAPVPDVALLPDVTDECTIVALVAPTATDNCGGVVTVTHDATLPITAQGTTLVTWTYDDGNGNTSTQPQNVVITDITAPVPDLALLPDVTDECTIVALVAPTATDNCGGVVTVTHDATLPITAQGTTLVTWTYDDGNGNTSTQPQNVVITDITAPVPDVALLPDLTDECSIAVLVPPTATDNCGGVVTVTHDATLPITAQGTTLVTWTYDDGNGNTSTQPQNVILTDVTDPIPDLALLPDVTDECSVVALVAPTATDNCGGVVTVTHDATLPITAQGTTLVTWTYDDGNGNTVTQPQNVILTDITAPVPDVALLPDVTDECTIVALVAPTATDNCGGVVTVTHDATLPITAQGTTLVTWTYDDGNGNTSTQPQNVVITDITAPVPDLALLPDVTDECTIVALVAPTATDNCGGVVTVTHDATLPITAQGTTLVTWTYDDGNGNTSTQPQNVVITDITAPVPDLALLPDLTDECSIAVLVPPTATDNCGGVVTVTHDATLPITAQGTTLVTWTYDDGNGNTVTQPQNVVLTDITAPVPDVALLSDVTDECTVVALVAPTATDNCGGVVTVTHDATLPITAQGTTLVTWTYDDGNGNTVTQPQNVVLTDITAPIPDVALLPDVTDECTVVALVAPTATDNCGGVVTVTHDATLPITAQGTTLVTWTYDDGNGNTSTQPQNVVITDITAPVPDLALLPDLTDECSVVALVAPTATDNCGGVVTVTHDATLPITAQGTTLVTWTYDDGNGNTSTQPQNVVITDITAPVPDVALLPDLTDECSIAVLVPPTATDNCGGVVTVTHDATLPITAQGTTLVTWTYDDGNGNTSTQSQNVILTDVTDPIPDLAVLPDVTDECSVVALVAPTATDNCGGVVTVTHDATLPITAQGTTLVTWTYDDGNGNTVTQPQNVVLTDITAPVLVTLDTIIDIGAGGLVTIDSSFVFDNILTLDNCNLVSVTIDKNTFDCTELGANTINVTAFDEAGNSTSGTAIVTVNDPTPAVAFAGNDEVMCITDASFTLTSATVTNGTVIWGTTGDGTFDDPALVNPTYTLGLTDADSVKLYMDIIAIAGCQTDVDTMKLTIYNAPTVDAGADIDLCGSPADVSITGASSTNGTILWTTAGDGTFDDDTAINPVYTFGPSDTGPVTLTLTVTGPGTCGSVFEDLVINFVAAPTADAGADDVICGSATTYAVTDASSSGGTILWTSDGDGTFDDDAIDNPVYTFGATDITNGNVTLTITVTGGGSCGDATSDKLISINETPVVNVLEHTDITCNGLTDGILRIEGTGGTSPYTYSIDGGLYGPSGDFTGLAAAPYFLSVMDFNGCVKDTTITIIEPATFTMVLDSVNHNSCFQSDDAAIYVTAAGGTTPYAVSWTGPNGFTSTSLNITGLEAGLYSLNLTDANSCNIFTLDTTIVEPPQILITPVLESDYNGYGVSCSGSTDGFIEVNVSGGTGTLTILWTGPNGFTSTDEDIIDLEAGDYTLTVTDNLGCFETYDVTISEPLLLDITYSVTDANCPGDNTGEIDLTITGGVGPFTVLWDDGNTNEDRIGISEGSYTVDVSDANLCTDQVTIVVDVLGVDCIQVPEIITPGNVDGKNDDLRINNIGIYPDAEIKIFNRWGKMIFNTKNLNDNRWDGTFKGKPLPVDSYHYILDLGDGSTPLTGTITIIR